MRAPIVRGGHLEGAAEIRELVLREPAPEAPRAPAGDLEDGKEVRRDPAVRHEQPAAVLEHRAIVSARRLVGDGVLDHLRGCNQHGRDLEGLVQKVRTQATDASLAAIRAKIDLDTVSAEAATKAGESILASVLQGVDVDALAKEVRASSSEKAEQEAVSTLRDKVDLDALREAVTSKVADKVIESTEGALQEGLQLETLTEEIEARAVDRVLESVQDRLDAESLADAATREITGQAVAAIRDHDFVTPDDIKRIAPAVLSHRLIVRPESRLRKITAADIVEEILDDVPVPTVSQGAASA